MNEQMQEGVGIPPSGHWARVWLLSALLLLAQGLLGGFYYETNDDPVMMLLVQGTAGAGPVSHLHLYFHGWSELLAALYRVAPAGPWYALLLYTLLYLALVVSFWTIEQLGAGRLSARALALVEAGFYALTYFLHAVQINFTRPALLLGAAAGLLLLVPRPGGRQAGRTAWVLAGLVLLAGWGVRPSGAMLGLALTLPLALWQGWRRGLLVVGSLGSLLLALTVAITAGDTAEVQDYRRNDIERSELFDYKTSQLEVHTRPDSLAYATLVPYQGLHDSVLLNKAFFARAMHPATGRHATVGVYTKALVLAVGSTAIHLPGCLLLVAMGLAVVVAAVRRGQLRARSWPVLAYAAYQGMFWAVFLLLVLHLPLRVLQPIVTIYSLVNLVLVLGCLLPGNRPASLPAGGRRGLLLAWAVVAVVGLASNAWLVRRLSHDNALHTAYLAHLAAANGPGVLIEQDLYALYDHLAPFGNYHLGGYRKIVMLTGWVAYDPSQPRLRQALTGTRDLPTSLLRLSRQPGTSWVMQPAFARLLGRYLNERLALPPGQRIHFELLPDAYPIELVPDAPRRYQLQLESGADE